MQKEFNKHIDAIVKEHQIKDDVFAVGVSGGADSLALVFLLKGWADKKGKKIVALSVDHKLRVESTAEAEYVSLVMKKIGVEHHILTWDGKKPKSNLEEAARVARYGLLENWCVDNKVSKLMIAHHKMDQAETFFLRLQRGSGVDGLSGMNVLNRMGKIEVLRPLLGFMPDDLKKFLTAKKIKWVEDPHNSMDDFLRVRVRKFLPVMEQELGICVDRIVDTMEVLSNARSYFEKVVAKFVKNNVKKWAKYGVSFSKKEFMQLDSEISYRVLACLIKEVGENYYVPRADGVKRILTSLAKEFKGATLGGCEIFVADGKIWIVKELRGSVKTSKKQWEEFVEKNPKYKNLKIPYKLRLCLMS